MITKVHRVVKGNQETCLRKAGDDEHLQVELGCDAHEKGGAERIVEGLERLGVGAARDRVEQRRLHLHEALVGEEVAQRGDHGAARHEGLAGVRIAQQLQVALTIARLECKRCLGMWQGADAWREQLKTLHVHGELARFVATRVGTERVAARTHNVAATETTEPPRLGRVDAPALVLPHELHGGAAPLDGDKVEARTDAVQTEHAARRRHRRVLLALVLGEVIKLSVQLRRRVRHVELVRVVRARIQHGELVDALVDLLLGRVERVGARQLGLGRRGEIEGYVNFGEMHT